MASILSEDELRKIEDEVNKNVILLFGLGMSHYNFAMGLPSGEWRQCISRIYYAAYNVKRALTLQNDGGFSTESGDHMKIDQLPDGLENADIYRVRLKNLRDDRNICDYSHSAGEEDLLYDVAESRALVASFVSDVRKFLSNAGVAL